MTCLPVREQIESNELSRQMAALYTNAEMTIREIATLFGCSHIAVRHRIKDRVEFRPHHRRRGKLTPVLERVAKGMTLAGAARDLGISVNAVYERIRNRRLVFAQMQPALIRMSALQLDAYCKAIDEDELPHEDALEIALEYGEDD